MLSVVSSRTTTGENLVGLWRPTFTADRRKLYVFGGGRAVNDHLNVLDLSTGVWSHITVRLFLLFSSLLLPSLLLPTLRAHYSPSSSLPPLLI